MIEQALEESRRYRETVGPQILGSLAEFLAIPNVSSIPGGLDRNAIWIRDELTLRGARAAVTQLPGAAPLVFGRVDGEPGGPTIGFYAHFDGQPADPAAWASPPFEPTLRYGRIEEGAGVMPWPPPGAEVDPEWRVYARGSADDRGAVAALLGALDARTGRRPHASLVFVLEGEEESGSPHLGEYLGLLADRLRADVWVVCDGPVHADGSPVVAYGVRGLADVEITVYGPPVDLHSGHYGDWAPNPAAQLSRLVTGMVGDRGVPAIAGLAAPDPGADVQAAAAAAPPPAEPGFAPDGGPSPWERALGTMLNVRGLASAGVGDRSRNVVPRSATASLDLRLAAGQDPAEALEAVRRHVAGAGFHLTDGEPDGATRRAHRRIARVEGRAAYPGVRTPLDDPAAGSVVAAVGTAAGAQPIVIPSFGSSMPLHHFEVLDAPLVIVPIANHDGNQHGPDENLRVGNLWYGIDLVAALLG